MRRALVFDNVYDCTRADSSLVRLIYCGEFAGWRRGILIARGGASVRRTVGAGLTAVGVLHLESRDEFCGLFIDIGKLKVSFDNAVQAKMKKKKKNTFSNYCSKICIRTKFIIEYIAYWMVCKL